MKKLILGISLGLVFVSCQKTEQQEPRASVALLMSEVQDLKTKVADHEAYIQKSKQMFEEYKRHIQALEAVVKNPRLGNLPKPSN